MIKKNLFLKNNIQHKYFRYNLLNRFIKNFQKIKEEVNSDINSTEKTLCVLNSKFKCNCKLKNELLRYYRTRNLGDNEKILLNKVMIYGSLYK